MSTALRIQILLCQLLLATLVCIPERATAVEPKVDEWWIRDDVQGSNKLEERDGFLYGIGSESSPLMIKEDMVNTIMTALSRDVRIRLANAIVFNPIVWNGASKGGIEARFTRFQGPVDLRNSQFGSPAIFENCTFEGYLNFNSTKMKATKFDNSALEQLCDFDGAEFDGDVSFAGVNFLHSPSFVATDFKGDVDFATAVFHDHAHFDKAKFSRTDETISRYAIIVFDETEFRGNLYFGGNNSAITPTFTGAAFHGWTNFSGCDFFEPVFDGSVFFENVEFRDTTFINAASFVDTEFHKDVDFLGARFTSPLRHGQGAQFGSTKFLGFVNFSGVDFIGNAVFSACKFEDRVWFLDTVFRSEVGFYDTTFSDAVKFQALYSKDVKATIEFSGVHEIHGFVEWEKGAEGSGEIDIDDSLVRGLRGHLKYDRLFFGALHRNFLEQGLYDWADSVYLDYRRMGRMASPTSTRQFIEWLFLDRTFGYGVLPFRFLGTFSFVWASFALYYLLNVRSSKDQRRVLRRRPDKGLLVAVAWSLLHSLSCMSAGLDLGSREDRLIHGRDDSRPVIQIDREGWFVWGERLQQIMGWYLLALFLVMFSNLWMR